MVEVVAWLKVKDGGPSYVDLCTHMYVGVRPKSKDFLAGNSSILQSLTHQFPPHR